MKIKGTAVKITPEFVKTYFNDGYDKWMDSLPPDSKQIMSNQIIATEWYPLYESVLAPTEIIARLFLNNDVKKAATEVGKHSADVALKGVYKIFVMISTPAFMLSRASSIFSTYYHPADIRVTDSTKNTAKIQIKGIAEKFALVAWRIGGWMEKALEITKRRNINVDIDTNFEPGNEVITISLSWE